MATGCCCGADAFWAGVMKAAPAKAGFPGAAVSVR